MFDSGTFVLFAEIWTCVYEICKRTDKQTNRHADTLIAILRIPTGNEVKKTKSNDYEKTKNGWKFANCVKALQLNWMLHTIVRNI